MVQVSFKDYSTAILKTSKEIHDALVFQLRYESPGARFSKPYKMGYWDGYISPLKKNGELPAGCLHKVHSYCVKNSIPLEVAPEYHSHITENEIESFIESLPAYSKGNQIFIREDQTEAVVRACTCRVSVNICPTSFGKSLSIYYYVQYHLSQGRKSIIVVPTVALVSQMISDFKDYGFEGSILGVKGGVELETADVVVGTYQTLTKHKKFINNFDCLILDECHKIVASNIQSIFNSAVKVKYRSGWTGTLEKGSMHFIQAELLIGKSKEITTTASLMGQSVVANLSIDAQVLKHGKEAMALPEDYQYEIKYLNELSIRNKYIADILPLESGLVLFNEIAHGELLHTAIREKHTNRSVYFIYGNHVERDGVIYKSFDDVKSMFEIEDDSIIVASYGVFSTGISIKNVRFILLARTVKSVIRLLQSIGRGLRVREDKTSVKLIDIIDDFGTGNYTFEHGSTRIGIYKKSEFKYTISEHSLVDK